MCFRCPLLQLFQMHSMEAAVIRIPGFTAHSRYPAMMAAAGLSFSQVLDRLIETAVGT